MAGEANRLAQERAGQFPDGQTSLHAYFQSCTPTIFGPAPDGGSGEEQRAISTDPPMSTARVLPADQAPASCFSQSAIQLFLPAEFGIDG